MTVQHFIYALAIGRALIGLAPFVAISPVVRMLGFPAEHDNPTARVMARLFGVRNVGLGVMAVAAIHGYASLPFVCLINVAHDCFDATAIVVPLVRRQGMDRAVYGCLAFAFTGGSLWAIAWSML